MAADRAEAEAIVQEAWLRAWKHKDQLDPSRPALPWLARIAVNIARDEWRRRRPLEFSDVGESVDQQADDGPRPGIGLEREEARRRLVLAIESLRPEWKMVLALRYDGGLSYAEIAEVAGLPLNTVRTYLHRAHAALRRELEPGDG
jgi:RNA polymerase sigma-70 factor (ECF subfamily)